jgi:acetoin utilization protein AcuA
MRQNFAKEILKETRFGSVQIRSFCTSTDFDGLEFDSGFSNGKENKSLFIDTESLMQQTEQPGTSLVLAISGDCRIIGFAILAFPEPGERWADLRSGIMMEVKAIEVVRRCRSAGVGGSMLRLLLDPPWIDNRIIYMVGFSWTWDLSGASMTAGQYRQMLLNLFKPHGFEPYQTNEPNICLKPENLFLCRIGRNITGAIIQRFKWLRFGLSP